MQKKIVLLVLYIFYSNLMCLQAQDLSLYKKLVFTAGADSMPYRLLLPLQYDAAKKYPLVVFLHGSGERGKDNEAQLIHGGALFLRDSIRQNYPAIVLFPQCPSNNQWANVTFTIDNSGKRQGLFKDEATPTVPMQLLQALLQQIITTYPVNKKQVYVGGLSMGGMGTFEIAARNPKLFAAALPICGGGAPATAKKVKKINWWVFHGDKDEAVPWQWSQTMVDALQRVKANVKFSLYPGVNHNSWDNAFAEPDLLHWLFAQHK
jgi:predicted peptidase